MTRYPIGTRCVIVQHYVPGVQGTPTQFVGRTCVVVEGEPDSGYDYVVEIDGEKGEWDAVHQSLRPIDGLPANTVTSWESCPFQPEREVTA